MHPKPAGAVHPGRIEHVLGKRQQPRQKENHAEAQLTPDDHSGQRTQSPVGAPQPVLGKPPQADRLQRRVERAVQGQELAEQHPHHRHRQHVGDEDRDPVKAPAAHALVQQNRDQKRDPDDDRQGQQQSQVVADRDPEERVVQCDLAGCRGRPTRRRGGSPPPAAGRCCSRTRTASRPAAGAAHKSACDGLTPPARTSPARSRRRARMLRYCWLRPLLEVVDQVRIDRAGSAPCRSPSPAPPVCGVVLPANISCTPPKLALGRDRWG